MRFCLPHWEQLKQALKDAGMSHLITNGGEQLAEKLKRESEGQAVVPDPLFEAHNMMLERAMNHLGPYIMFQKEDGTDYCPLCEVNEKLMPHPETKLKCADSWISTIVPYLKEEYTKEGWLNNN